MNKSIAVWLSVIGLFVLAALIARPGVSAWLPASLLVICGSAAFLLSPVLAKAEQQLAKKNKWVRLDGEGRPLKFQLCGIGIIIVGIAWLIQGAA
ncbi:MAG: hypothetical protein DDT34_02065 [Firmicutes bacterium]|nr:hypothetical protein [Bacillota bacterium]